MDEMNNYSFIDFDYKKNGFVIQIFHYEINLKFLQLNPELQIWREKLHF